VDKAEDSKRAQIGRAIFKQFNTVVILDKQNRVTDVKWANILSKLRVGQCDHNDLEEIQKLVLSNPDCIKPNFQETPWSDAILVTPRHAVREAWNEHSVVKHCKKTGNRRYLVPAYDVNKETNQELPMEARLAAAKAKSAHTGKLADRVEVAVGMKAMVLLNLATEADIANGTRGVIHDIILDERDKPHIDQQNGTVNLRYPPAMILFKPDRETTIKFQGIELGLIPITPSEASFTVEAENGKKYRI
jgi:hypothetical protein